MCLVHGHASGLKIRASKLSTGAKNVLGALKLITCPSMLIIILLLIMCLYRIRFVQKNKYLNIKKNILFRLSNLQCNSSNKKEMGPDIKFAKFTILLYNINDIYRNLQ